MVNRYPSVCYLCGGAVPAKGGALIRHGRAWLVAHLACRDAGEAAVETVRLADGVTLIRNSRGRCEDAPCCGCCTY